MNDSKAITLSISAIEDMGARFTDAWHRAEKGEDVGEAHLSFPDLPASSSPSPSRSADAETQFSRSLDQSEVDWQG